MTSGSGETAAGRTTHPQGHPNGWAGLAGSPQLTLDALLEENLIESIEDFGDWILSVSQHKPWEADGD